MARTLQAVFLGLLVAAAGTLPRNLLFLQNLRFHPEVPWAVPIAGLYIWLFWRYLDGSGPPDETSQARRTALRARRLPLQVWAWSLLAGALGIVSLVVALGLLNRLVNLPLQRAPELDALPPLTAITMLLAAAPIAGIVEESAFRGYMQGPLEARYGPTIAILITGTAFAIAHLDFTLILWPYYVAVAAIYGMVTYLTGSILPAVVLHTAGNLYSNFDLWMGGRAEWQAGGQGTAGSGWGLPMTTALGLRASLLLVLLVVTMWAYWRLAKAAPSAS